MKPRDEKKQRGDGMAGKNIRMAGLFGTEKAYMCDNKKTRLHGKKVLSDRQLRKIFGGGQRNAYRDEGLQETISRAKTAFAECEAAASLSSREFLWQQGRYIRKRWWALQAGVLFLLGCVLQFTGQSVYTRRCLAVAAALFAVLILPELWKNRNAGAMEVECAAYYSLRQIYGARVLLFGMVDLLLMSGFALAMVTAGRLVWEEMLIQFLLPFTVSCCICFRCLYSRRSGSEVFALFLCTAWTAVWLEIVLQERVYEAVSRPVWLGLLALAVLYLTYCIDRGQKDCGRGLDGSVYVICRSLK